MKCVLDCVHVHHDDFGHVVGLSVEHRIPSSLRLQLMM